MIELKIDVTDFERRVRELGAQIDQLPFALSRTFNESLKETRRVLAEETWPQNVTTRNTSFMRAALRMEFSTKRDLRVSIFDSLGRAHLALHAKGGVKQGKGRLAIPTKKVTRTASGVLRSQLPRGLKRKVVKGNLLFQAVGRGKNSKLQLLYKLAPRAVIKPDVPFYETFRQRMAEECRRTFPAMMARAMETRRRR